MNKEQIPLGIKDEGDEAGAWVKLKELITQTVSDAVQPKQKYKPGTIAELSAQWLDSRNDAGEGTKKSYRKHLDWLCKHIGTKGNKPVGEVDVNSIIDQARRENWSDSHRCNTLWCVGAFLRWCGRTETIPLPPKESRGGDSVISDATHKRALLETHGDFRQFLQFLWLTGCRPGEASGLLFERIDWDSGTITLKKHKTRKKGKTRILYLASEAVQILREQSEKHRNDGLVFRGQQQKRLSLKALTMRFQRLSERLGVTMKSYDYRHTFATRALSAGIPDTQVAAMLGHSSTAMIHKHYSHVSQNARLLKGVVEQLAKNP